MKLLILASLVTLIATALAVPVPVNYAAGYDPKWSAGVGMAVPGASISQSYSHAEHLEWQTDMRARAYKDELGRWTGDLEADIASQVIGQAHIAWQSTEPGPKGRPRVVGRSVEDLTGVFSIEKFIQLWADSRPGEVSIDWMPCL
jgi:hypothetical protein